MDFRSGTGSTGSDAFPNGGAAAGAEMRSFDWRATVAGPPVTWPPALRAAVTLALDARSPMLVCWEDGRATVANDAWQPLGAACLPGQPGAEAWPAVWPAIGPLVEQTLHRGTGAETGDVPVPLHGDAGRAEAVFRFAVSPVRDEDGSVVGALCTATETTDRQQLQESADHLRFALEAADASAWSWDPRSDRLTLACHVAAQLGLPDGATLTPAAFCERFVAAPDRGAFDAAFRAAVTDHEGFAAEFRLLHADGASRWTTARARFRHAADDADAIMAGILLDIDERKRAEERQHTLMAELDHRVKNTLLMIQSMARQSIRGDKDTVDTFVSRLMALAGIHTLLAESRWSGASLDGVVERAVAGAGAALVGRVTIGGPAVELNPAAAQTLGLALHELAVNAAVHGSLSVDGGTVAVSWRTGGEDVVLDWRESGGPPPTEPAGGGFGRILLERMLDHELGGRATRRFAPEGVSVTLSFPIARASREGWLAPEDGAGPSDGGAAAAGGPAPDPEPIRGRRILVVEDSFLVAMAMEDQLLRAGAEVVGPAGQIGEAVDLAEGQAIDAAVLDVNLNGDMIWPVAEALARRGIPFAFVTGYQPSALLPEWRDRPRLTKPADEERLLALVESLLRADAD